MSAKYMLEELRSMLLRVEFINKFDKKLLKLYLKYCCTILVLFPTMLTIQIQFRLLL